MKPNWTWGPPVGLACKRPYNWQNTILMAIMWVGHWWCARNCKSRFLHCSLPEIPGHFKDEHDNSFDKLSLWSLDSQSTVEKKILERPEVAFSVTRIRSDWKCLLTFMPSLKPVKHHSVRGFFHVNNGQRSWSTGVRSLSAKNNIIKSFCCSTFWSFTIISTTLLWCLLRWEGRIFLVATVHSMQNANQLENCY